MHSNHDYTIKRHPRKTVNCWSYELLDLRNRRKRGPYVHGFVHESLSASLASGDLLALPLRIPTCWLRIRFERFLLRLGEVINYGNHSLNQYVTSLLVFLGCMRIGSSFAELAHIWHTWFSSEFSSDFGHSRRRSLSAQGSRRSFDPTRSKREYWCCSCKAIFDNDSVGPVHHYLADPGSWANAANTAACREGSRHLGSVDHGTVPAAFGSPTHRSRSTHPICNTAVQGIVMIAPDEDADGDHRYGEVNTARIEHQQRLTGPKWYLVISEVFPPPSGGAADAVLDFGCGH